MTIISMILFKYALLILAVLGLVESRMILKLNQGDLRTLLRERVNGPKKISTELRINQSAYLLAVFCILLLIGAVQALTPFLTLTYYMQPATLVSRLGLILLCGILIAKQRAVRRHRERLDLYYDAQQQALDGSIHIHRRQSDPPLPAKGEDE